MTFSRSTRRSSITSTTSSSPTETIRRSPRTRLQACILHSPIPSHSTPCAAPCASPCVLSRAVPYSKLPLPPLQPHRSSARLFRKTPRALQSLSLRVSLPLLTPNSPTAVTPLLPLLTSPRAPPPPLLASPLLTPPARLNPLSTSCFACSQPPLAGSINWSHSLFLRVRKTIAKFQSVDEDLFSTEQGKEVSRKFVQVSKAIRRYEKSRFEDWKETVNSKAMQL